MTVGDSNQTHSPTQQSNTEVFRVTMSIRTTQTQESNANPSSNLVIDDLAQTIHTQKKISDYEQSREDRIKENHEKLQKLGIFDLSLKLKSQSRPKRAPKSLTDHKTPPSALPSSGSIRRSSRLQNVIPVTYSEVELSKKDKGLGNGDLLGEVGSKLEVYTEEHEKLLGNTEKSWTFFVDGYDSNGSRIYDSIKGKTCHQCRQKTLGFRTHCCRCDMVQGQFCGDCLYMRYGEHVLEALENPDWICPPCRGICNCSLCRQAKGWAPTGSLYRKISKLGYKSVAHYLIQTHRAETKPEKNAENTNQVSVKRTLPFLDLDAASEKPSEDKIESSEPQFENKGSNSSLSAINAQSSVKRSFPFSEAKEKELGAMQTAKEILMKSEDMGLHLTCIENDGDSTIVLKGTPLSEKPSIANELNSESIGARLKRKRQEGCSSGVNLSGSDEKLSDVKKAVESVASSGVMTRSRGKLKQ